MSVATPAAAPPSELNLRLQDWLATMRQEYLETFIREGGAAVKFAVTPDDGSRVRLRDELRRSADENGFQFVWLDAESTKLHLIDRLFHDAARQIDWDELARTFLMRTLLAMGLKLPVAQDHLSLPEVAALNDYLEMPLRTEVIRTLSNRLYQDHSMAREFRLAMLQLCMAQLDAADDPSLHDAVIQWLHGELRLTSALKRALIFQKIARHNARHMLVSLPQWLQLAGKTGLVLGLDVRRYTDASRPAERGNGLYYSTAATLDAYEVLRQLIDATDDLSACFVAVVCEPTFLSDDRRGLRSYHALFLRVADEVRDRYRPNPRAALVRLTDV